MPPSPDSNDLAPVVQTLDSTIYLLKSSVIAEPAGIACQWCTIAMQIWQPMYVRKFGCDVSVRVPARTDSRGGGGESQDNLTGGGESHLFLLENEVVLLGNQRFSRWEMA